jgi:hypothetical protein
LDLATGPLVSELTVAGDFLNKALWSSGWGDVSGLACDGVKATNQETQGGSGYVHGESLNQELGGGQSPCSVAVL